MTKVSIDRQIAAAEEVAEKATDTEAAQAVIKTLEFARDKRKHFELAALIAKDECVRMVEGEFPGARIVAVRRAVRDYE